MADETYNLEARISVDSGGAAKSLDRLVDEFASLNQATNNSSAMIDRWEKRMVSAAGNARTFTTNVGKGSAALKQQASAVANIAAEYQKLSRTQGTNIADMYLKGADEVQIAVQRIKNSETERIGFAKLQSDEYKRLEGEKTRAMQAAEKERLGYARQANQQQIQLDQDARAKEMASLKAAIQARAAIQAQSAKAEGPAYLENARRSVQGLVQQANGLNLSRGLARDFFSEFRNSKDIDKQRAYLDMMDHSMEGLANQRYALYDVAATMLTVTAATTGLVVAANAVEGSFDKSFGQVARTNTDLTAASLQGMRDQLEGLTHELPTAFGQVTEVATLGAQMNISAGALAGFTETVSQFSATTGTSLNETAMSLGRLAQLTGTSEGEISNLASSIYQTGINSVATEQQILEVASQIATAGDLAGFSNTQIIGLSSALASLGVAPEQSRGAIMRVFGDITEAVGTGGAALDAFAATSGMSASDFKSQWGTNSQEVFSGYLQGLSQLDKGLLDVTLKQQGFINVRDRNVLSRLANNTEVYTTALSDAGTAYSENTALAEGYNVATDNLIDNLTILKNILLDVAQSAGQSAIFNTLAKGAIELAGTLENIASSPVGQVLLGVVGSLTALIGIVAAGVAVWATMYASLLAITTGLRYAQQQGIQTTLSVRALTVELLRGTAASNGYSAALFGLANAETRAASAGKLATGALRGLAMATGIGAILVAVTYAFDGLATAMKSASDRAKDYYSQAGISTDFSEAIKADTAAFAENGEAIRTVSQEVTANQQATDSAKNSILNAAGARQASAGATDEDTAATQNNTAALGENVRAQLANTLASDERINKMWEESQVLRDAGLNMQDLTEAMIASPTGGADYLAQFKDLEFTSVAARRAAIDFNKAVADGQAVVNEAATSQDIFNSIMGDAKVQAEGAAIGMDAMGAATEATGTSISDAVNEIYGSIGATNAVEDALFGVGEALYENGKDFSSYSEAGRANMDAISQAINAMATAAGDDTAMFTSNVAGLLAQLQSQGINTGNELSWVGDMLNNLTGSQFGIDFNSTAARKDILSFIETSIKALQVRAQLERQNIAAANAANAQAKLSASVFSSAGTPAPLRMVATPSTAELDSLNSSIKAMEGLYSSANKAASASKGMANGAKSAGSSMQQGYKKAADAAAEAADKTKDLQEEVVTLEDYANDLSGVMDRVLGLMFGNQNASDSVFSTIASMKDDIADSAKAIMDARAAVRGFRSDVTDARIRVTELTAELRSLKADKKILEYQLSVAVEYGDDLRAAEIRGELAEKNAEITSTEKDRKDATNEVAQALKDLAAAQKAVQQAINDSSTSLTGNSKVARENRARVQELIKAYKDQITTAAANGASQSQLRALTARLSGEFSAQMRQMGYNRSEVNKYKNAFSEFSSVVKKVPRNVTVTARAATHAAAMALNEFAARKRTATVGVKLGNTPSVGSINAGTLKPSGVSVGSGGMTTPKISAKSVNVGGGAGKPYAFRKNGGRVDYLAAGGVGGVFPGAPKGTDTVPTWLTPGEFVQKRAAVDKYGLPFMNAVNSLQFPKYLANGSGNGSAGAPGVQIVELLPRQLNQLAQMVSATVAIDGKVVATSVNNQNRNSSIRKVG